MQEIQLEAIAKQSLTTVLDNVLYELALLETNGCMSADVTRGGKRVVSGQRIVAGQLAIPYRFAEDGMGNFLFLTKDNALPYYDQFATTQTLLFATNAELEAVRNGSA